MFVHARIAVKDKMHARIHPGFAAVLRAGAVAVARARRAV
jgi:hypothetical protein